MSGVDLLKSVVAEELVHTVDLATFALPHMHPLSDRAGEVVWSAACRVTIDRVEKGWICTLQDMAMGRCRERDPENPVARINKGNKGVVTVLWSTRALAQRDPEKTTGMTLRRSFACQSEATRAPGASR